VTNLGDFKQDIFIICFMSTGNLVCPSEWNIWQYEKTSAVENIWSYDRL